MRRVLEEARAEAILNPTTENVTAYLHLQQETLQRAAAFSDAFRRTVWATPELDYTLRRPVGALAKQVWSDERREARDRALARLGERYGLIYLGHAGCAGCKVFGPLLRAFAKRHKLDVLAVSLTGEALEGWPEAVADRGAPPGSASATPRFPPWCCSTPPRNASCRSASASWPRTRWRTGYSRSRPWSPAMTIRQTSAYIESTEARLRRAGLFAAVLLAASLFGAAPARADVLSEMNRFWQGAAVNTTGPTAFQGQASGHWTLGNLYLRSPVRSEQIATVSLPSFRAGCGGIDAFAGAFSFINSDQLVAFARAVAQNAVGFAFELALETISPVIAETMAKLRALAQWVNSQNLNSCETAQALVGALWSKNDRASAAICAAIGTGQGIFSDYAAAKHGCGADGTAQLHPGLGLGAMADQVPVNVNYAWKAIRASSFLAGDTQLAEFAMAVTGTLIVTAPTSDGDNSGPRVRILEPLALDRRVTEVLMEGGGQLPVYRCDTANLCLNPSLGTVSIPANRGFRARVAGLLRDLVDAVRTDTAPPAAALGLVNLTTLPVYRVANAAAAYRGAVIDQEMDALAEAVALDVMQVWITDLHRTVEERAGTLDIADGEQLQKWREGLRANRVALARHRHQGLQRLNTALAVVEKLRLIETELAGALSADLRAALAFARGGAGRGVPISRDALTPYTMYELFTLGGGTYLVDLLNAVAAITGGGAYIALAQLAGIAGPRLDPVPHRFRRLVEGQRQVDPAVRGRVGRDDRAEGHGQGGRPAGSDARAGGGGQRADRARALRLADQPGRRRADPPHRAGLHAAGRPRSTNATG